MRATPFPSVLPRFEALFVLAVAFLLQTAMCPTHANESRASNQAAKPTAHSTAGGTEFLLAVHPVVAKLGQPRTVFVYQPMELCPGTAFSLDTSLMKTQALVLLRRGPRFGPTAVVCPAVPTRFPAANFEFEFTPSDPGQLTVRVDPAGPEITIQTLPTAIASKFDTNGMWFDAATNGSGIALHHRRGTNDAVFGTWFLYNNNSESRWVTLQSANWQQDGSVLEGLLIQTRGGCPINGLVACPASGTFRTDPPQDLFSVTPSRARITFQSANRARAEVLSLSGAVLFTSELTKLQF